MADVLAPLTLPFRERVRQPGPWLYATMYARRLLLALVLAAVPGLILFAAAGWGPAGLQRALTDPAHVRDAYSRFVGAVATASAIAVSVTSLILGRELRGVEARREHIDANMDLRARVQKSGGRDTLPLDVKSFFLVTLDAVERSVERVREEAGGTAGSIHADGVTLRAYLDALDTQIRRTRTHLEAVGRRPDRVLPALLEFEHQVAQHFARAFQRADDVPDAVRDALEGLNACLENAILTKWYVKTVDTEWELSRMAVTVLVSTVPAIATAAGVVLAHGPGAVAAWGYAGTGLVLGVALTVILYPLAAFVSHLLRVVSVNRYTIPSTGFVLGPEAPGSALDDVGPDDRSHEA